MGGWSGLRTEKKLGLSWDPVNSIPTIPTPWGYSKLKPTFHYCSVKHLNVYSTAQHLRVYSTVLCTVYFSVGLCQLLDYSL